MNKELTSKKTTLQLRMHNVRLPVQAADSQAHICQSCRQTFMVTAKAKHLQEHADSKHPKLKHEECFPELPGMLAAEAAGGGKASKKK